MLQIIRKKKEINEECSTVESLPDNPARANVALIRFIRHVFQTIYVIKFCFLAIVAVEKNCTFL